jgi:hypothetical protein
MPDANPFLQPDGAVVNSRSKFLDRLSTLCYDPRVEARRFKDFFPHRRFQQ